MNETNLDALTMEQVRAMDNAALRVLVAEMLDYRIYEGNGRYGRYVFCGPWLAEYTERQLERFWDMARSYTTPEAAKTSQDVPDWPEDLDYAVDLLHTLMKPNDGFHWHLATEAPDSFVCIAGYEGMAAERHKERGEIVRVLEYAPTPARAVTLAWVAWKLATREATA